MLRWYKRHTVLVDSKERWGWIDGHAWLLVWPFRYKLRPPPSPIFSY